MAAEMDAGRGRGMLAACLVLLVAAPAAAFDRPAVVEVVEDVFDGFFQFATDGGGRYAVYQKIEDPALVRPGDMVVCMPSECLLQIAEVPEAALADSHGRVREPFREVRDLYRALRVAALADRPAALAAWRDGVQRVADCLADRSAC